MSSGTASTAATSFPTAFLATDFLTAVFVAADCLTAVFGAASSAAAVPLSAPFVEAVLLVAAFVATVSFTAAFVAAVFWAVPLAVSFVVVFTALAARAPGAPCAFFFPPTSLAVGPVDLSDADCCTAVFFATMAAAPSHIVILRANRAGTINRLPARGNGARLLFARPAGPARPTCMRCAQLPAG